MRSQSLVHVHALLYLLREHLEQETAIDPDAFRAYDEQPIRPRHIHRSKQAHKRAIQLILGGFSKSTVSIQPEEILPPQ